MSRVDDVVAAILERTGMIDTWKLQKLVYYCQAWSLVWDGRPLFDARIEAWANGPVVPALYSQHRGSYTVDSWNGNPKGFARDQLDTIDVVVSSYRRLTGRQLSQLTHAELPWREARKGLAAGERGHREIALDSMAAYYGMLDADAEAARVDDIPGEPF